MDVSFSAPWAEGAVRKDKDRRDEPGMTIKYNINMLGFIPLFCSTPRF
jgi:hypothetical protein